MTTVDIDAFICQSALQVHCRVDTSDFGCTIPGEAVRNLLLAFWRGQSLPIYRLFNARVLMTGDKHDSGTRTGIPNGRK